jgi:ribosomal protein S18 acetylase RimI-like enzyme
LSTLIRPMTRKDKSGVMDVLETTPQFLPDEVVVAEEVLDCYLDDPSAGYFTLVAESDHAIAGYVTYGETPLTDGTWDIYWIAVSPNHQKKGIGGALMAAAETEIARKKGRMVMAETSSKTDYADTHRFYVSQGYRLAARIEDFYAPGDDIVFFQKLLR